MKSRWPCPEASSMAQDSSDDAKAVADQQEPSTPSSAFKFNVHAPEFVPMSPTAASPMSAPAGSSGFYSPFLHMQPDWSFFHEHAEPVFFMPDFAHASKFATATAGAQPTKPTSAADMPHKIVKQVEYQFSDINLVANEFLLKIMNKDSEVPLSVIASWKKIKSLGATNQMLVKALRTSTKLIVSDDGKKVRRRQPFSEKHKEELQSRMIIAENLPEDSSRNSLEKIFGVVGSVKNIKMCHPQEPTTPRSSKSDTLVSNKMHALVEYESSQQAEKAVEKLNDERNWRKGLRVRTVLRRSPKSVMRLKRTDFDHLVLASDEDVHSPHSHVSSSDSSSPMAMAMADYSPSPDPPLLLHADPQEQQTSNKNSKGGGGGWARGGPRGMNKQLQVLPQSAPAGSVAHFDPASPRHNKLPASPRHKQCPCPSSPRHPHGPRMPDGTRGFTMGRGKPLPPPPLLL
ncbi:la-related protein 6C-like isoform X2 [Oryza brachyantha]|uniref:la-related protein 6C-like isoform X2 n=1 Tax=Oryza brachyantha TaxID=4533 RepID=UPI00077699F8|nr:la-related protein 6C-like isoform X2 [Oryza brachyantha]